jgi:Domain of unknown function (DUF4114)
MDQYVQERVIKMKTRIFIATLITIPILSINAQGDIPEIPDNLYTVEIDPDLIATVRSELPESRAVGSEFLDPSYQPVITMSEAGTVSVSFIDEGAGFRNSLAWIAFPNGAIDALQKSLLDSDNSSVVSLAELTSVSGMEYGLVFPNVSREGSGGLLLPGDTVDIDGGRLFAQGTQIVFCLLQNAWKNGEVEGYDIQLESTTSLYTADLMNPESPADADIDTDSSLHSSRHVAMLFSDETRSQIIMGFEDLHRTDRNYNDFRINSDEDFNDAVFIVSSTPPEAISETDIAEADPAFNPRPEGLFLNPDCCGVDTSQILEVELPERTNVNAEFLNPDYTPSLVLTENSYLVLSFIGEGAIYQNSLGYFTYPVGTFDSLTRTDIDSDSDGVVEPYELRDVPNVEVGMVFAHASVEGGGGALAPTEAVFIGNREFQSGYMVDFFLVQDGWNDNGTVKDFSRESSQDTLSFYTLDFINPEQDSASMRHVAMMFTDDTYDSVLMGFEDLHRMNRELNPDSYESDEDFNDNVFCISPVSLGALQNTDIPVAGDTCEVDLDNNQILNFFDITTFLNLFTSGDPAADFNNDGRLDFFDFQIFVFDFSQGC